MHHTRLFHLCGQRIDSCDLKRRDISFHGILFCQAKSCGVLTRSCNRTVLSVRVIQSTKIWWVERCGCEESCMSSPRARAIATVYYFVDITFWRNNYKYQSNTVRRILYRRRDRPFHPRRNLQGEASQLDPISNDSWMLQCYEYISFIVDRRRKRTFYHGITRGTIS